MTARDVLTRELRSRELASDSRAGAFARSRARRAQRAYIRERWRFLVAAWLLLVAPVPIVWWFLPSELLQGVFVGAVVTGATATVWFWVVQSTGTAPIMMGDEAEQWTAQELRRLGRGWRLVNRFLLSFGDIDHIVIGPAGALVVETKWSAHPWRSEYGLRRLHGAVRQVEDSARRFTRWENIKTTQVRVLPVVVLWGGETRRWPTEGCVRYIGDVAVVAGHHLREFVHALDVDAKHGEATDAVWRVLDAHARKREGNGELLDVPLSAGEVLARVAWFVAALVVGFVGVAEILLWTGSFFAAGLIGAAASVSLLGASRRWKRARVPVLGAFAGTVPPTLVIAAAGLANLVWL